LGELYEREYLKKTAGYDRDAHEKQTEEDAAKDEMKRLFANLCSAVGTRCQVITSLLVP
jgi:U3 small nucleolar RNA-associated protein MPP10